MQFIFRIPSRFMTVFLDLILVSQFTMRYYLENPRCKFVEVVSYCLAHKIRRHEEHILNTIETKLSNARVESINNKIKLFIRKAYGFRNIQNMLDMLLLGCSNILIPLPNRGGTGLKVA